MLNSSCSYHCYQVKVLGFMKRTFNIIALSCLTLILVSGSMPALAVELKVVAVSAYQKKKMTEKAGKWSPFLALTLKPVAKRVDISERTEFYAILIDNQQNWQGKAVVFKWYYRKNRVYFTNPVTKVVQSHPGYPHPMAEYSIWSGPSVGGKFLSFGGLRSVRSYKDWNDSRCYGPRTVKVTTPQGLLITETSFEIHEPGVHVY